MVSNAGEHVSEPYYYDPHGDMLRMPQLQQMRWDGIVNLADPGRLFAAPLGYSGAAQ
jgi:hypothetical protein